jgi:D-alanine-D-alanine ligase
MGVTADAEDAALTAQRATKALDVTVLMGGPSAEREVSLMSGAAVADALGRWGHRVCRADILPSDRSALDRDGIDGVFIALHGEFGESGEVQRLCESRQLRYTGSPPRASELAMDKAATKQIVKRAGIATPDWMIVEQFHTPRQIASWLGELPPPVVLKPVDGGSSVDVVIARTGAERDEALEALLDKYGRIMLERFVEGRELTVGILGDEALPLLEIRPAGEFYDYRAKYADGAGTEYTFDHGLGDERADAIRRAALAAHRALGCRDMSRVDFLLDEAGAAWLLEINTIPGFTSHSLLPMAAARVGIGFGELTDRLVAMAAAR